MTKEDITVETFDALPKEYRDHIGSQFEIDFRDMEEAYFLDTILGYELIDIAMRTKRDCWNMHDPEGWVVFFLNT